MYVFSDENWAYSSDIYNTSIIHHPHMMKRLTRETLQVECGCNFLGVENFNQKFSNDVTSPRSAKGFQSDKNTNKSSRFGSTRKLSIGDMKRRITPGKYKPPSDKGCDFLKFTTSDHSQRTISYDSINMEVPERRQQTFATPVKNFNALNLSFKPKEQVYQKKYSTQTQSHPPSPLLPLRKIQSLANKPRGYTQEIQVDILNFKQIIHKTYPNSPPVHPIYPSFPTEQKIFIHQPQPRNHIPHSVEIIPPEIEQQAIQERVNNSLKTTLGSVPSFRLAQAKIVQSIFDKSQSALSKRIQKHQFKLATSENPDNLSIGENNESIVIERLIDVFPRSTFTEGAAKYLQVPHSTQIKNLLKNSASSHKQFQRAEATIV